MCIAIGPEEDDFMCIALPMTTTTTAHISTMVSLVPSSIPVSLSPTPIPTPVPPNSPPRVLNPIGTLIANEGQVTHFAIPELTFYDPESGSTSNLTLSLLNFNGNELQNTTWIHITNGAIQVLPLRDQAVTDLVSEHTFILRASDELGASTHDFVTVRLLRQRVNFQNFLVVFMEGSFAMFNETLQDKISLAQGLSVHISNTSIANVTSTENIYIKAFRNGSIAAVYRDISIPDTHCADFASWVETVYFDSSYSPSFIRSLAYYRFVPTSIPVIEGPCNSNDTVTNPTVAMTQRIPPGPRSDLILFLATVVPTVAVACLGLVVGMILFATYHSRRSEREKLTTRNVKNMFTHRRPVILDEEWDLPNRRRRPVILPGDRGLAPRSPVVIDGGRGTRPLLEELDYGGESDSSDDAPGLSLARTNRYSAMSPDPVSDDDPPPYVPPL